MPLLNTAAEVYAGAAPAQKVYLGSTLVWSSAPWSPKSIPGLTLWIDAQQQVDSDGAKVTVVRDFSPDNRACQVTPGNEPYYRASLRGKPCFEWAPPAYGLDCGQWNPGTVGLTYLFVGARGAGDYPMMAVWGPDADGFEMRHDGSTQQIVLRWATNSILWLHPTPSPNDVDHLWALRLDRASGASWTNRSFFGGQRTPDMPNVAQTLYVARRQGGFPWIGAMREVLVYAGAVGDADMAKLFDYLTLKWALTV